MTPKTKTFLERTFSTVILLGLLGGAVAWDEPIAYAALICIFCNLTTVEWFRMLRERKAEANRPLALPAGLAYPWLLAVIGLGFVHQWEIGYTAIMTSTALGCLILYTLTAFFCELFRMDYCGRSGQQALASMGITLLSFIYPVWLFSFALFFLQEPGTIRLLLWLILFTKMSDIFAYVSGILMGGKFFKTRRFSPVVSPKKTWEGIIGSFIITLGVGLALAYAMIDAVALNLERDPSFILQFLGFEAALFVLAVAGDLAGSLIKRGLAVKDSGSLLPGIGGIFDLIDSPAFTVSTCFTLMALAHCLIP